MTKLEAGQYTAETAAEALRGLLHPEAQRVMDEGAVQKVAKWVGERIKELGIDIKTHALALKLNAYNEGGAKLGLQSVVVSFLDQEGELVRPADEYQDPTVGVVAKGMVEEEVQNRVGRFAIARGNLEKLTAVEPVRIDTKLGEDGQPALLEAGKSREIPQFESATVILEQGVDAETALEASVEEVQEGVYICIYQLTNQDE